jgi:cellulose synthase/poly-beta-1,6-N-acetylglucosamine synthase-like glycosyltransferase
MDMNLNEMAEWNAHMQTPVVYNHHEAYEVNSSTINDIDLDGITSTAQSIANREKVLILTPLRDAAPYLQKYFELLYKLSYPHDLIDLAFLVGDSKDDTESVLAAELQRIQEQGDKVAFRSATIVKKNFGADVKMNVQDRHSFAAQGPRRKAIGRARNYLLYSALKADHSWVYWRDVDISDSPETILQDFMAHDRDILVPSM